MTVLQFQGIKCGIFSKIREFLIIALIWLVHSVNDKGSDNCWRSGNLFPTDLILRRHSKSIHAYYSHTVVPERMNRPSRNESEDACRGTPIGSRVRQRYSSRIVA